MRILYTGAFRFPHYDAGAHRVLNNAKILRDLGHEVIFVAFGGKYQELDRHENGKYYFHGFEYIISDDLNVTTFTKRVLSAIKRGVNALNLIKQIPNIDIIISYNPTVYFSQRINKFAQINGIKHIIDLTEWYDVCEFKGQYLSPLYWLNKFNMEFYQKHYVRNFITISSFLDEYYDKSNNIILPPLVDVRDEKWTDISDISTHIPEHDGYRLIYAGTPTNKDQLKNIIDGLLHLLDNGNNKIQLLILGVSQEQSSIFIEREKLEKFDKNIVFLGRVQHTDVPSYYRIADFSVMVRTHSRKCMAGFPTKVAESLAAGCPVLYNETSDIGKYLTHLKNGIKIEGYTPAHIVEGLNIISTLSKEDLSRLREQAYRSSLEDFDYTVYRSNLQNFINNCE